MTAWDWLERMLRWLVAALALVALWLPAFTATVPFVPPRSWSVATLDWQAARAWAHHESGGGSDSISHLLEQVGEVRKQFPGQTAGSHRIYAIAASIPAGAMLASLCAVLAVIAAAARRRRMGQWIAGAGLTCAGYGVIVAWCFTSAARADLDKVMARVQANFGSVGFNQIEAGLLTRVGFLPQVGLYLLILAFVAMLLLPA